MYSFCCKCDLTDLPGRRLRWTDVVVVVVAVAGDAGEQRGHVDDEPRRGGGLPAPLSGHGGHPPVPRLGRDAAVAAVARRTGAAAGAAPALVDDVDGVDDVVVVVVLGGVGGVVVVVVVGVVRFAEPAAAAAAPGGAGPAPRLGRAQAGRLARRLSGAPLRFALLAAPPTPHQNAQSRPGRRRPRP